MCWERFEKRDDVREEDRQEDELSLPTIQTGQDQDLVVPVPDRESERERELTTV